MTKTTNSENRGQGTSIQVTFRLNNEILNEFNALAERKKIKPTSLIRELIRTELRKKICPRCGTAISIDARFCSCCSHAFTKEAKQGLEEEIEYLVSQKLKIIMSPKVFFEDLTDAEIDVYEEEMKKTRERRNNAAALSDAL